VQLGITPPDAEGKFSSYAWFQKRVPTNDDAVIRSVRSNKGYRIVAAISWDLLNLTDMKKAMS